MRIYLLVASAFSACVVPAFADPGLTIYNQNFAVVRDGLRLDLKAGENSVQFAGVTAQLEPDSVILRDPAGKRQIQILEQNYRNDPVSVGMMLELNEGKTIDFLVKEYMKPDHIEKGRVIRSGYAAQPYYQGSSPSFDSSQAIIEVSGQLRFGLPGQPLFPALADDTVLKPTLDWKIQADADGPLDAEISYVTGGLSWNADYNVVAPEKGDALDMVGWITMNNQSGKAFANAKVKLIAGDVNKIQPAMRREMAADAFGGFGMKAQMAPPVQEKSFDEYHMYTLNRASTLRDRETKQVEFVRAEEVNSARIYVYDGADLGNWRGQQMIHMRSNPDYGTESNTKVWVMREFKNSKDNNLGIPLPKGRLRFYRQDDDGQLQFIGENEIDHTPKDEVIRVYTGNAFDVVGERTRTNFSSDVGGRREGPAVTEHWFDETFEIKLRNHKEESVDVRVVEHLYRWTNWEIRQKSDDFTKTNAQEIEFRVSLKPDEEKVITYQVHYSW